MHLFCSCGLEWQQLINTATEPGWEFFQRILEPGCSRWLEPGRCRPLFSSAAPAAAFVLTWLGGGFLLLFEFGDDGGTIFIAGIGKQIALFGRQGFALAAEADAFMVGQFKGELLDSQLAPFEFSVALDELGLQG